MKKVQRFKNINLPIQAGEVARLKVVKGPDYGTVYVISATPVMIGRGEDCDILLADVKTSRHHILLSVVNKKWMIADQGSVNGILLNTESTRLSPLKLNDVISIGETTLEFVTLAGGEALITAAPRSVEQIDRDQKQLIEEKKKFEKMGLAALFSSEQTKTEVPILEGAAKKRKLILISSAVVLMCFILFVVPNSSENKKSEKKKEAVGNTQDLSSFLPTTAAVNPIAENFFKDGFREFVAGNFMRARVEFETVLSIAPGHPLAKIYLENCNAAIKKLVQHHLEQGKKDQISGKLKSSRSHYEAIIRLLYKDRTNENYIKAQEYYEKVVKEIKSGGDLHTS